MFVPFPLIEDQVDQGAPETVLQSLDCSETGKQLMSYSSSLL